jgi:hypothetical protein
MDKHLEDQNASSAAVVADTLAISVIAVFGGGEFSNSA